MVVIVKHQTLISLFIGTDLIVHGGGGVGGTLGDTHFLDLGKFVKPTK